MNNTTIEKNSALKQWMLIAAVLLLTVTSQAANYANNIVLPAKLGAFNAMGYYALFATLSGMGMMISLPMVGAFTSQFGVKYVTLFGLVAHFVVRFCLMFAGNAVAFAAGWILMGFAAGLYMSAPYSIMADIVPSKDRPKFYGYIATASAFGALIGPALTGAIADAISANSALLVYGIFGIFPLFSLAFLYPNKKRAARGKFDFLGIALISVFVCCTVLWLSMVTKFFALVSLPGIGLPVLAIVSMALLIKVEMKAENPSVPIQMFKKKRFAYTFCVQMLMVAYSTCITAYVVVYVQSVMHGSALASSTVTMPQTIVQAILGFFVGGLIGKNFKKRFRPAALLALSLYILALLILSTLRPTSSMMVIYVAVAIGGVSQAVTQSIHAPFFQSELSPEEIAPAQGMFQFSSTGGASIFGALCGAAMNMGANFNQVFLIGAAFVGASLVIAFIGFRFPKEEMETA